MLRLQDWYPQFEIARWFALGESSTSAKRIVRSSMLRKLYPEDHPDKRGANNSDVLAIGLLDLLHREGYDVSTLQFDTKGKVLGVRKRPLLRSITSETAGGEPAKG